jgi:eukaryotic-like serine/threonine-protein kinase
MRCTRCGEANPAERLECAKCGGPLLDAVSDREFATTEVPEATREMPRSTTGKPGVTRKPAVTRKDPAVHASEQTFSMHGLQSAAPTAGGSSGEITLTGVFAGRYEILAIIGEGGMGRVYKARDRELDKTIALKTILGAGDADSIQRFKHELVLARKITHKNVVRIYDLGEAEGVKYFTMEYIEGDSLKAYIRHHRKVPFAQAIELARQILGGLQEAHAQGVIHRDLKPQNIMVDHSRTAHLMDFGIARSTETTGMTATGAVVGTPDYISPEQVKGEKAGPPSDIFSFGVILYEMLTGDLPFHGDTPMSKIMMRLTRKPRAPREVTTDIPKYLEMVVLKCMDVDPALRYQHVGAILADLDRHHVNRTLTTRMSRAVARQRGAVLAIAPVAAIALGAWWWSARTTAPGSEGPVHTLAIVPFTNAAGSAELDWMRGGLPEMLVTDLSQSKYVRPVSGQRVLRVLDQAGVAAQTRFDEAALESVSKLAPAESVLSGQFLESGGKLRLDLTLRKAGTGVATPVKVETATADVFGAVDQITRAVKQQLDLKPAQIRSDTDRPVAEVSTSSLEAQRAYQGGLAQLQQGAAKAAIPLLQEATGKDPTFAMAYAKLAQAQLSTGEHDAAEGTVARALELAEKAPLPTAERYQIHATGALVKEDYEKAAETYSELQKLYPGDPDIAMSRAQALERRGKFPEAAEAYRQVIQLAPSYGAAMLGLGRVLNSAGKSEEAIRSLQDALATKQFDGKTEALGMIHSILGVAYRNTGQLDAALDHLGQSLELRKKVGDKGGTAVTLQNLASVYEHRGDMKRALEYYGQALELARSLGDRRRESNVLYQLAKTQRITGSLDKALASLRASMEIETGRKDYGAVGNRLNAIAEIYRQKGQYDDAMVYLEQAKSQLEKSDRKVDKSINLTYIGAIRRAQGHYDQAIESYLAALALSSEIKEEMGVASLQHDLSEVYADQGRYADAYGGLQKSLEIYTKLQEKHDLAETHAALGHLLVKLGQTDAASQALARAETLAREVKAEGLVPEILLGRAEVLHLQGRHEESAAVFEQANVKANLSGQKEVAVESRIALGELFLEQGRVGNAETMLRKTRQEASVARLRPLEAAATLELGEVLLARGDAEGAHRQAQEAIAIAEKYSGRPIVYRAQALLGHALDKQGKGAEALDAYAEAARTLDWIRGSLRPEHVAGFLARPQVRAFLRAATPRLEKVGRLPNALRGLAG